MRIFRAIALCLTIPFVLTCSEPEPLDPCFFDEDCLQTEGDRQCIAGTCAPVDACASGIFTASELPVRRDEDGDFPPNTLVRQVSGAVAGVSLSEGDLILNQAGEPRIFEIDFFDNPDKPADQGLYVEARMALGQNSQECTAVLYLWPSKIKQIKFCFGGGRIGLANPGGGSSSLVDEALLDLDQVHTYRLNFLPVAAVNPDDGEEQPMEPPAGFTLSLEIDGEIVAQGLTLDDIPDVDPNQRSDRAPLIGFGSEASGSVAIDFVRWGCNTEAGPCLPALQDDDQFCTTERQRAGECSGDALANELCDGLDNDCDGLVDENFTAGSSDGRPIGFSDFGGDTVYLNENCGLTGQCSSAIVVCSDDRLGLRCDVNGLDTEEICDGQDNDCDGVADEDFGPQSQDQELLYLDMVRNMRLPLGADCGVGECNGGTVVCQNAVPACSSAGNQVIEICGNGLDDDCDGSEDEGFDQDGDGFQTCIRCLSENCAEPHDCVDTGPNAAEIFPNAEELCNNRDDDCDGMSDEGLDVDGDGFLPCENPRGEDCDDDPSDDVEGKPGAADINPDADEVCDTVDNNCNGTIDEGFSAVIAGVRRYPFSANCGSCGNDCRIAGDDNFTLSACVESLGDFRCDTTCRAGFRDVDDDLRGAEQFWNQVDGVNGCECRIRDTDFCDNGDRGCAEICDGEDNDCDGAVDEGTDMVLPSCWPEQFRQQRGLGICRDGVSVCADGEITNQCAGAITPVAVQELTCDGLDEDCDGRVDEGEGLTDSSGQIRANSPCNTGLDGVCADGVQVCTEGEMRCIATAEGVAETCDGRDNDCDGTIDEDTDFDRDGAPQCRACRPGDVPNGDNFCEFDCNDTPGVGENFSPLISEVCTGDDNDCDNKIDEDFVLTDDLGHPIGLNGQRVFEQDDLVYNQNNNCGGCGSVCSRPNGLTNCDRGTCELTGCEPGFLDEDGNPDNGCEQSDCRPDNVGPAAFESINTECSKPMYDDGSACGCRGFNRCVRRGGVPAVVCVIDDNNPDEGDIVGPAECPQDRRVNAQGEQCDALDNDCDGQADEDFVKQDDVGEPILDNDGNFVYATNDHCGACNIACQPPFTLIPSCSEGACEIERCNDGRVNLDGEVANGCEYECTLAGQEVCDGDDDDCDGSIDETFDLQNDVNNCGECGNRCSFANAGASCVNGECLLGACNAGFDNCDGDPSDGCETNLNEEATCGGCNNACDPTATSACVNQQCVCGQDAPCVGDNPVCDDVTGTCTGCLNNGDCADPSPFCVSNSCRQCDPLSSLGCEEGSATPICNDGQCEGCVNDAECVVRPGNLDFCDEASSSCVQCDPVNNAGCPGNMPTCDANTLTCRACENADDCLGNACVNGTCSGCDVDTSFPCSGATPICAVEDGGSPECRACTAGAEGDAECFDKDDSTGQCVQGRCQACDPSDHAGCGDNQLCCNFVCVDTDPDVQCETCGVACDATTTNSCDARACTCGAAGECGGQTAFCDDDNGACVNCRGDDDCGAGRPECVNNSCEACDPSANIRCDAAGASPVCDPANKFCRQCGDDSECTNDAAVAAGVQGGECIADGSCRVCDPDDNAGCPAADVRPICALDGEGFYDCRRCNDDAECASNVNGNVCAGGSGRCTACQSDADCDGHPDGNLCNDSINPAVCGACANDAACSNHPDGNRCIGGSCFACAVSADCAGNPAGETCVNGRCAVCEPGTNEGCTGIEPICANGQCQACANDAECGANFYCIEAVEGDIAAADVGSCQRCDPVGNSGCDANSNRPVCDPVDFFCRICGQDSDCGENEQCLGIRGCKTCDPDNDDGCVAVGATPVCRDVNDEPTCTACQADAECAENAANGPICVGGACGECDPADNSGCRDDELCCDDGGGARCVSTGSGDGEVCTACNVNGCNANSTNTCANRTCLCGDGAACDVDDFCVGGTCVNCVRDADCSQDPGGAFCVANDCVECRDSSNCGGQTPVCDGNVCRACANNAECGNNSVCVVADGTCTGDDDGDGVDNSADNCRNDANPDQLDNDNDDQGDVCDTDDDNDTVEDDNDNCPFIANQDQLNSDNDAQGNACDGDDDNDQILDEADNCPLDANVDQADLDNDDIGNVCDDDRDGDTVNNDVDNCPDIANADQANLGDLDAEGDVCDDDDDNDGANDDVDNCPVDANADQADQDADMTGDVCDVDRDGDGVNNDVDNCPNDVNADQADVDDDDIGDVCDNDRDGDNIADGADNCPDVANADQTNSDDDGLGDACDADDDNDGVDDGGDNCPLAPNADQLNTDNAMDGGDVCDDDDDNDGTDDGDDNCPLTANADQADNEPDGTGDACDDDDDNDGVDDNVDNCPFVSNANQLNTDGEPDGGNACDDDDDDDGVNDDVDTCPLLDDPDQTDTDGDGDGNPCDADDDGDGELDASDNCPLDANADQADLDSDGDGDACDDDDDGDGILDVNDNCPRNSNADQADGDGDGVGNVCDNCVQGPNADQADADTNGSGDVCDSPLIINEIDYNNPGGGADNAEYVEILNQSNAQVNLNGVEIQVINGGNTVTVQLSTANATIDAGQFLVIGDAAVTNNLPQGVLSLPLPGNQLPNNATALVIRDANRVYDSVVYHAAIANEGEGNHISEQDLNSGRGLERCSDVGDNDTDFQHTTTDNNKTPGAANVCD